VGLFIGHDWGKRSAWKHFIAAQQPEPSEFQKKISELMGGKMAAGAGEKPPPAS
jgi:hypothetical protein